MWNILLLRKKKGGGLFVAMETQKRHVLDNDLKAEMQLN